ncbi:MAG: hypothetical protein M5U01_34185 [Ardenticatenaceae bacterium]|nr:hypothetical protein [Ardenticatenaceae bacterium]
MAPGGRSIEGTRRFDLSTRLIARYCLAHADVRMPGPEARVATAGTIYGT